MKEITRLNLDCWTTPQIAEKLGVDERTVRRDLEAIRNEWRRVAIDQDKSKIDRELTSLERDEKDVRSRLEDVDGEHADRDAARYHDVLLKIRDRRAKLLGLDAPTKIEQKTEVTGPLRIEYANDWSPPVESETTKTVILDAVTPEHSDRNGSGA